eukprot:CAMPEP_0181301160 /NCGR_PEP_ID=MMETSP1101-20121128/7273_1 /TAXON_ID=46948 /ORGANISM="Rhodomonas abbreviata, Strain Caron Lab Isolate" /LENGTH=320 /DNA_ID=CAMNT_0023406441 /DNA_START=18 /DNA_END=980 /DNA_ORIENTATION=+
MQSYGEISPDGKNVKLNNGTLHPLIGFGTYKVGFVPASSNTADVPGHPPDRQPKDIIKDALATGYRYIDCAQFYGNEAMVGEAITESGVPRSELFLVSKVWGDKMYEGKEAILAQLATSLASLQTDYLDMYLIHWPVPGKHVAAYQVLEECLAAGKVRAIGVSNYTVEDYTELEPHLKVVPVVNQIEVNPFLYRPKTLAFFASKGVVTQSYRALRQGKGMEDATVQAIAQTHNKTPSQVLGRFCVQRGIVLIAKTVRKERMLENLDVFSFQLAEEDMQQLDKLTTEDNLKEYKELYDKCVVRDTPLQATKEGIKAVVTMD